MTNAERCKMFVEDIKAYWDYTLITKYGWVLLIKDDYLRASIGEAILKGVDDKIIIRLTKLYVLIEDHDDLINLFTENQNTSTEITHGTLLFTSRAIACRPQSRHVSRRQRRRKSSEKNAPRDARRMVSAERRSAHVAA